MNVGTAIAEMLDMVAKTAIETRPIDATPLRAEMMTLVNDALNNFEAQTAVDTPNHVRDALNDLHQTLPTPVRTAMST